MDPEHRTINRHFETEIRINGNGLSLNNFIQETLANTIVGFSQTLKHLDEPVNSIEITIRRLEKNVEVDAHKYP
jgi:hypothetical protein